MESILRIIRVKDLRVHETSDPQRVARLARRLRTSTVFTHPPIVVPLRRGKYLVLDGANRLSASQNVGLEMIPVQVVDYANSAIKLGTWNHVIEGVRVATWLSNVQRAVGTSLMRSVAPLPRSGGYIDIRGGRFYSVPHDPHWQIWKKIVATYNGHTLFHRIETNNFRKAKKMYPHAVALIVFPRLTKKYILACGQGAHHIPSGVSRHLIPGRVLHVDVPFRILRARTSLDVKNQWLKNYLMELTHANRIRHYAESVFLYDE